MSLKPIAPDDLDRQRGGLRLGQRRVTFGIHAVEARDGRLIATYRYRMAPAPESRPLPPPATPAPSARISASAVGKPAAPMQTVPRVAGNLLIKRFKLHGPRVVARGALPRPSEPAVSYLTTGEGGRKEPVRPNHVGRFRIINRDEAR